MVPLGGKGISLEHQKQVFQIMGWKTNSQGGNVRGQMCTIGQLNKKLTFQEVEVVPMYSSHAWHLHIWGDWVCI